MLPDRKIAQTTLSQNLLKDILKSLANMPLHSKYSTFFLQFQ